MNQDDVVDAARAGVDRHGSRLVAWRGCNGNGQDDGWAQVFESRSTTRPPRRKVDLQADARRLAVPARRALATASAPPARIPNTAICSWTEGNTQPQRDGTWMAAIDITRQDRTDAGDDPLEAADRRPQDAAGRHAAPTRCARCTDRIMLLDPTTGDARAHRHARLALGRRPRQQQRQQAKGGTYYGNNMAVIKATKAGMHVRRPDDRHVAEALGIDGTHLGMRVRRCSARPTRSSPASCSSAARTPAVATARSSRRSAGTRRRTRSRTASSYAGAPYDRHLYPNYLGNNPGNQGRNYSGLEFIKNPFATGAAGEDAYLMVIAIDR